MAVGGMILVWGFVWGFYENIDKNELLLLKSDNRNMLIFL
jgi:hypothetical protein